MLVIECSAYVNGIHGISTASGCTVRGCTVRSNTGDGINVNNECLVIDNMCSRNGSLTGNGAGIHVIGTNNRIIGNNCVEADRGIDVDSSGNFISRNICSNNTTNWDIASGNVCLVVLATNAGVISGNSGGSAPGSTDPNANFTY